MPSPCLIVGLVTDLSESFVLTAASREQSPLPPRDVTDHGKPIALPHAEPSVGRSE